MPSNVKSMCTIADWLFAALYLLPFSLPLRSHFSTHELKGWAELMVERGLRLRIPFELFWTTEEVEENEGAIVLPEDEELAEDELRFLGERQALKPY